MHSHAIILFELEVLVALHVQSPVMLDDWKDFKNKRKIYHFSNNAKLLEFLGLLTYL